MAEAFIRVLRDDRRPEPVPRPECPHSTSGLHKWSAAVHEWGRECLACGKELDREQSSAIRSNRHRNRVRRLWHRDGQGCFYCRQMFNEDALVLDHFIPASAGGADTLTNRRASCVPCDTAKGGKMPWEFMPFRFAHLRDVAVL